MHFPEVLRNIDADAAQPDAAGPGHWNDPDYLGPDQGMSATQFRSQFSMWSILAAPLMISDDLTQISRASLATVSNPAVVAIDQDHAGIQGRLISTAGSGQAWAKPLADGSVAVALLNRGSKTLRDLHHRAGRGPAGRTPLLGPEPVDGRLALEHRSRWPRRCRPRPPCCCGSGSNSH